MKVPAYKKAFLRRLAPGALLQLFDLLPDVSFDRAAADGKTRRMNTPFHCPRCAAAVEGDSEQAGMQGDCPACGGVLVIPVSAAAVPPPKVRKTARDVATGLAADAVCAAAKLGWKAFKFAVPVALKVTGRATVAAAPAVRKAGEKVGEFVEGAVKEVKAKPAFSLYMLIRWFTR